MKPAAARPNAMIITLKFWLIVLTGALLSLSAFPTPARAQPARPITLAEAVTLAIQNNLQLRAATFEVAIARAQLNQALAARAGQLTGSASYTRTSERDPTQIIIPPGTIGNPSPITISLPPLPPDLLAASLTYQYPLHTGGRLEAQIALARANVRGAEATLDRVTQDVLLGVKQAYFQLLVAQAGIEVAERALAQAQELLRVAQARVRAGVSPQFDEIQARVNRANAEQTLLRARNGVALATHALNALLALRLDTDLRPQETMAVTPVQAEVANLIARAIKERPEVRELQARQAAAAAAIEIARAGGRPVVVVNAGTNATGSSSDNLSVGWSVTLAVTVPLFDGNLTRERIREAELRLKQLKVVEAQLRQNIELDVRRALLNLQAATEEVRGAEAAIAQAGEAVRLATVRFEAGVGTNLEAISAQTSLTQAEANRIQALFNYNAARAQLERAVGGPVE